MDSNEKARQRYNRVAYVTDRLTSLDTRAQHREQRRVDPNAAVCTYITRPLWCAVLDARTKAGRAIGYDNGARLDLGRSFCRSADDVARYERVAAMIERAAA